MTNPFNRGSSPRRAREASQRPDSFKPGHAKVGGRKKGTPNALSADYKKAAFEAAYRIGSDGNGKDGVVGYFQWVLTECPEVAGDLLGRVLALEACGYWPNEQPSTKDEINEGIRRYIGIVATTKSEGTVQWPVTELMHVAVAEPASFCKMLGAIWPQPSARLRRAMSKRRQAVMPNDNEQEKGMARTTAAAAVAWLNARHG